MSEPLQPDAVLRSIFGRPLLPPPLVYGILLSFSRLLWMCAVLVIGLLPGFVFWRLGLNSYRDAAIAWWIAWTVCAGQLGTVALRYWKLRFLYDRCWIVALRPFHRDAASSLFRNLVAPTLGCYGSVHFVGDESFERSARKPDARTLDLTALGDPSRALDFSDDEWRQKVFATIALSDLAVIDLGLPSENLVWETICCARLLPPHRVFLIGIKNTPWEENLALLRECFEECVPAGEPLPDPAQLPRIDYGGILFGTWRFRIRLFRAMRNIAALDRAVASSGTWRPPQLPPEVLKAASRKLARRSRF